MQDCCNFTEKGLAKLIHFANEANNFEKDFDLNNLLRQFQINLEVLKALTASPSVLKRIKCLKLSKYESFFPEGSSKCETKEIQK